MILRAIEGRECISNKKKCFKLIDKNYAQTLLPIRVYTSTSDDSKIKYVDCVTQMIIPAETIIGLDKGWWIDGKYLHSGRAEKILVESSECSPRMSFRKMDYTDITRDADYFNSYDKAKTLLNYKTNETYSEGQKYIDGTIMRPDFYPSIRDDKSKSSGIFFHFIKKDAYPEWVQDLIG